MALRGRLRNRRVRLRGWFKWVPFLLLPFSLLFTEAYLRIQRTNNDYETNRINDELERINTSIDELKTRKAAYDNLEYLDARAAELKFVKPGPNQVEIVKPAGAAPTATEPNADMDFPTLDLPDKPEKK
jgi:hypothetical protein